MTSPGQGAFRAARSVTVALAIVLVSLLAHLAGGGASPEIAAVALLTLVTSLLVWPLSGRPAMTARLVGVLGVSQVGYHAAFVSLASSSGLAISPGLRETVRGGEHLQGALGAASGTGPTAMAMSRSLPMLAAHGAACLVVAFVLTNADAVLWRLYAWLRRVAASPARVVLVLFSVRPAFGRMPVVASRFFARCVAPGRAPPTPLA